MLSFCKQLGFKGCGFCCEFGAVLTETQLTSALGYFYLSLKVTDIHSNLSLPYESREKHIGYKEGLGQDHSLKFYQPLPRFLVSQRIIMSHPLVLLPSLSKKVALMSYF